MTSKTLDIPDMTTEPSVAIVAEEATIPSVEPTFGQKTLTAKKIAAIGRMSLEVGDDSIVSLGDMFLRLFAEKIAQKEDEQALEGDGVGANFTGLFSAAGVNSVAGGGAIANLDKFVDAIAALAFPAQVDESLTWIFHPKVWRDLNKLKATTNEYILNQQPTAGVPRSLLGIPVRLTDQISVTRGAGSDTTVYVGAFARGMIIGDRLRMTLGFNPFTAWSTAQIDVRVIERVGILVAIPKAFTKITGVTVS
jgi:HK97 family phage major capsid protein